MPAPICGFSRERMANPSSLVGTVLSGRYRLTKLIGQGGMGSVYEAHDRQMADRQVAVKVLAPHLTSDETQVTRFEQEARAANQLRHPNTISVLDFGRTDHGLLFMALEYLHGETLTQVMRWPSRKRSGSTWLSTGAAVSWEYCPCIRKSLYSSRSLEF